MMPPPSRPRARPRGALAEVLRAHEVRWGPLPNLDASRAFDIAVGHQRLYSFSARLTADAPPPVFHSVFPSLAGPAWVVAAIPTPETAADWAIAVIVDDVAEAVAYRRLTRPGHPPKTPRRTLAEVVAATEAYVARYMPTTHLPEADRLIIYYESFHRLEGPVWEVNVMLPPSTFEGTGMSSILVSDDDGEVAAIIDAEGHPCPVLGRTRR